MFLNWIIKLNFVQVFLYDSIGDLVDSLRVNFTTTATQHHQGAQQGEEPDVEGEDPAEQLPMEQLGCFDFCA